MIHQVIAPNVYVKNGSGIVAASTDIVTHNALPNVNKFPNLRNHSCLSFVDNKELVQRSSVVIIFTPVVVFLPIDLV